MLNYQNFEEIAIKDTLLMSTIVKVFLSKLNFTLITKNVLNICISQTG
jgi:hypothetical protein